MQLEATGKLIKFRLKTGKEVTLRPGVPVDLPEESARKLLTQAGDRVRVVSPTASIAIEPAAGNARPIYWETGAGKIIGPARPDFLAKVGEGSAASFWVVTSLEEKILWVRSDRLRSKSQFENQMLGATACRS